MKRFAAGLVLAVGLVCLSGPGRADDWYWDEKVGTPVLLDKFVCDYTNYTPCAAKGCVVTTGMGLTMTKAGTTTTCVVGRLGVTLLFAFGVCTDCMPPAVPVDPLQPACMTPTGQCVVPMNKRCAQAVAYGVADCSNTAELLGLHYLFTPTANACPED